MDNKEYLRLKTKFLKAFANLPKKIRSDDTLAMVDDQPYTWNAAAIEIKNDSETGKKIINILKGLEVI